MSTVPGRAVLPRAAGPRTAVCRAVVVTAISTALLATVAATGCAQEPPKRCEGAKKVIGKGQRIKISTVSPIDETAGGQLEGKAPSGNRPMRALLLLDYSGSMYPGYSSTPPADCDMCKATAKRRNKQPYYYAIPEFRQLLGEWVAAAGPEGSDVELDVLLFNANLYSLGRPDVGEPAMAKVSKRPPTFSLKLTTATPTSIAERLAVIPPDPIKADRKGAQRTQLKDAIEGAVKFLGDEGLLWIVTDNISDRTGVGVSQADAARNLAFYNLMKDDPRLQSIYAYPLHAGEGCSFFCSTSLFVYGIHFSKKRRSGTDEANRLAGGHLRAPRSTDGKDNKTKGAKPDGLLWNDKLQKLADTYGGAQDAQRRMGGVPLRLKPLDVHVVSVDFARAKGKDGRVRARPLKCKRTVEFGQPIPCLATLVIKNNLRHQRVQSAKVVFENDVLLPHKRREKTALSWASQVCKGEVEARTARSRKTGASNAPAGAIEIKALGPGEETERKVLLLVPPVTAAPTSVGELFDTALSDDLILEGTLTARIQNVRTTLEVPPEQRAAVYGADSLPRIFTSRSEAEIRVSFPLRVPVSNDGKLRGLMFLGALALIGLLVLLVALKIQRVPIAVLVDGVEVERLSLSRFSSRKVERGGAALGRAKRGFGRQVRFVGAKGAKAQRSGAGWSVTPRGGVEMLVELRSGWGRKRRSSSSSGGGGGF